MGRNVESKGVYERNLYIRGAVAMIPNLRESRLLPIDLFSPAAEAYNTKVTTADGKIRVQISPFSFRLYQLTSQNFQLQQERNNTIKQHRPHS